MRPIAGTLGGSARASSPEQAAFIGNQAGGRVFLFLKADDFDRDYDAYRARGVRFRPSARQHRQGAIRGLAARAILAGDPHERQRSEVERGSRQAASFSP